MIKDLLIISAGDFGREVYTWACQAIEAGAKWRIKGFLDNRKNILENMGYDIEIISSVENYQPLRNDQFLCALGDISAKKEYCKFILEKRGNFATLIHPSSIVGPRVEIGEGSILSPFTQLSCEIKLGKFVSFGTFSSAGHDVSIGDWSQVSSHCAINGRVRIEKGVFIGSGAVILPDIKIEEGAFVGAGSVVVRGVKAGIKVFGNPAMKLES